MAPIKFSIYNLKSGKFQVSYLDSSNKRIRRKFNSYRDAKDFELRIQSEFESREALNAMIGQSFKIEVLVLYHFENYPNSKFKERYIVYESFMNTFGQKDIYEVRKRELVNWFDYLRDWRNYTEKTLSHIKAQVNHFYRFLGEEYILDHNPLDGIKFKQSLPPRKTRVIFSPDEISEILNQIKMVSPEIMHPFFYAVVHTGCRRTEMANLKWGDVNFSLRILTFRNTKNGTNRTLKLSTGLYELLKSLDRFQDFLSSREVAIPLKSLMLKFIDSLKGLGRGIQSGLSLPVTTSDITLPSIF